MKSGKPNPLNANAASSKVVLSFADSKFISVIRTSLSIPPYFFFCPIPIVPIAQARQNFVSLSEQLEYLISIGMDFTASGPSLPSAQIASFFSQSSDWL